MIGREDIMKYEAVIGLEVHVQLKTESKMFTRVGNRYGEPPNTLTDPLIMGFPGTLPVMNRGAIEKTIKVGQMFGCDIAEECKWDRKSYFYPDQPKNYQISQYNDPLCRGGEIEIELPGSSRNIMGEHRRIRLNRIHLEEDAAKLTHFNNDSLVDFNRSGVPLIEIVTEPVLYSEDEVYAFLVSLRTHMLYGYISDCDMEKGQLRCDANISVRPRGNEALGNKVELKNMNSITGVRNGCAFEIRRQIRVCEKGGRIDQETRLWDAEKGVSILMRSKEEAHDYRYFPDPDLMPVRVDPRWRGQLANSIPELPFDRQRRFFKEYGLPYTDTSVLCHDRELADFFELAVNQCGKPKGVANLIVNDLLRELSAAGEERILPVAQSRVKPEHVADLVRMTDERVISKQVAQDVLVEIFQTGCSPATIVQTKGLQQVGQNEELDLLCAEAVKSNEKAVSEFKSGKEKAINVLKGQVMKETRGRADPRLVDEVLREILKKHPD